MTSQRGGITPSFLKLSKKTWATGVLAVGVVAVSGGVAIACEHGIARANTPKKKHTTMRCLRLDKQDLTAINKAQKKAKNTGTIMVKVHSSSLVPCPAKPSAKPSTSVQPTAPTSADPEPTAVKPTAVKPTPVKPTAVKPTTVKPAPTTAKPKPTTSAS